MAQPDDAIQSMYEDPDLRDELRDEEANLLLKWAEGQIRAIDTAHFDERFDALRGIVKTINRLVGRRTELDAETRQSKVADIITAAQTLGIVSAQSADNLAETLPTMEDSAAVQALTALVAPPAKTAELHPLTSEANPPKISADSGTPAIGVSIAHAVESHATANAETSADSPAETSDSMMYLPLPGSETLDRTVDFTLPTDQTHLNSGDTHSYHDETQNDHQEEDF